MRQVISSDCHLLSSLETLEAGPPRMMWTYVLDTKLGVIKTWATVTKRKEGFYVTEMKKKVVVETFVSRKSDPFRSSRSFIDSGTIERK